MPLITQANACKLVNYSISGLRKLAARDASFPIPIKFGNSRQSPVFYDEEEIINWIDAKKAARFSSASVDSFAVNNIETISPKT
ncbi:MAG: hypothetical protein KGO49_06915 [Gammaproteobacteria bacterium]|nr:hypothetical protein [Gammaproteobacteria bacterium]